MIKLTVTGVDAFVNNIHQLTQQVELGGREGVQEAAEFILSRAQARAPVRTGLLKDSGKVVMGDGLEAFVSYGDDTVSFHCKKLTTNEYAVIVHEKPRKRPSIHYKWLELALQENRELALEQMAQGVRRAL